MTDNVAPSSAATPAPPPPSSSEPTCSPPDFAFLVHSQDTLPNNLPPSVDNKALARQRRRRTSPEDQALLEAKYQINPKPDKATRMAITECVALGEKEVQIWFQNRRQAERRKSKPLEPSDTPSSKPSVEGIEAHSILSTPSLSQGSDASSKLSVSSPYTSPEVTNQAETVLQSSPLNARSHGEPQTNAITSDECVGPQQDGSATMSQACSAGVVPCEGSIKESPIAATTRDISSSQSTSQGDKVGDPEKQAVSNNTGVQVAPLLRRASSAVRMSLSLDGKAKIVEGDGISPPRKRPALSPGLKISLQRSKSVGSVEGFGKLSPLLSGRSRDKRSWEFCCNKEQRNSLTASAQLGQTGSAAGAIGLIRSRSINALQPNQNKRNSQSTKTSAAKRAKTGHEGAAPKPKPKLSRAQSSVARLQSSEVNSVSKTRETKEKRVFKIIEFDDSNKENWLPGTDQAPVRLDRPSLYQPAMSILKENHNLVTDGSNLGISLSQDSGLNRRRRKPAQVIIHEDAEAETTESEAAAIVDKGKEDLDCIKGLLSLSQGNWR